MRFEPKSLKGRKDDPLIALTQFFSLESRLFMNRNLQRRYIGFMNEYVTFGHVKKTTTNNLTTSHYFIPYNYAFNPESSATKLRVVWDASGATSSSPTLNDIFSILLRFSINNDLFLLS